MTQEHEEELLALIDDLYKLNASPIDARQAIEQLLLELDGGYHNLSAVAELVGSTMASTLLVSQAMFDHAVQHLTDVV
jgi:hypothetical protein